MSSQDAIRRLRDKLPGSHCLQGCYECCKAGVSTSMTELMLMPAVGTPTPAGCVWLKNGKCEVYAERPFRCRVFGLAEKGLYHCPDCKPDRPLTDEEAKALIKEYDFITAFDMKTGSCIKEAE